MKDIAGFKQLKPTTEKDIAHIIKKKNKKVNKMLVMGSTIDESTN